MKLGTLYALHLNETLVGSSAHLPCSGSKSFFSFGMPKNIIQRLLFVFFTDTFLHYKFFIPFFVWILQFTITKMSLTDFGDCKKCVKHRNVHKFEKLRNLEKINTLDYEIMRKKYF